MSASTFAATATLAADDSAWEWIDDVLVIHGPVVLDPDTLTLEEIQAGADVREEAEIHADMVSAGLALPAPDACPPGHWAITDSQDEWPENWESA